MLINFSFFLKMSTQDIRVALPPYIKLQIKILQDKIQRNFKNNSIECEFIRVTQDSFSLITLTGDLGIFNFTNTETQLLPYNEYSFSFQKLQFNREYNQLYLSLIFDRTLIDHLLINVKTRRRTIVSNIPIVKVTNVKEQDLMPVLTLYSNTMFKFNVVHIDIYLCNEVGDKIYILVAGKKGISFQPPSYYQQTPSQLVEKAQTQAIPQQRGVIYDSSQALFMQNLQGKVILSKEAISTPKEPDIQDDQNKVAQ